MKYPCPVTTWGTLFPPGAGRRRGLAGRLQSMASGRLSHHLAGCSLRRTGQGSEEMTTLALQWLAERVWSGVSC
jgi:hypothetical protein